jgi:hypothetical protein
VGEEEEDSKIQILQDFIFDIFQNNLKNFKSKFITEVSSSDEAEITFNDIKIKGRLRNKKVRKINYQEIQDNSIQEEEEQMLPPSKKKSKIKYCLKEEDKEMEKLSAKIMFDSENVQEKQKIENDVDDYDWGGPELSFIIESGENLLQPIKFSQYYKTTFKLFYCYSKCS